MQVLISLKPVQDRPRLIVDLVHTAYQGQEVHIPIQAISPDGGDPFVELTGWNGAAGTLRVKDGDSVSVISLSAPSPLFQWASGYASFSSQYPANDTYDFGIAQIIGPPKADPAVEDAWAPYSPDGGCINRATQLESLDHFYTEYIEVVFEKAVHLTNAAVIERFGQNSVTRIRVPSDRDNRRWKTIYHRDWRDLLPRHPPKWAAFSPPMCKVLWPVDRVRVEVDTCHAPTWYFIDAVQALGTVERSNNFLNATAALYFQPNPGFTGNTTFVLTATDCYGVFAGTQLPETVVVTILPPPFQKRIVGRERWIAVDVAEAAPEALASRLRVLQLPTQGSLSHQGVLVDAVREDLASRDTVFAYRMENCVAENRDSFIVQLNPDAVVLVEVEGCGFAPQETITVVAISAAAIICVLVVAIVLLVWLYRDRRRNNRYAPTSSKRKICVVFTDIQRSTELWSQLPDQMTSAIKAHHRIVRDLIQSYKCYEVKTIGDAFMIVTYDLGAAVKLCCSIQDALYTQNWGDDSIDKYVNATAMPHMCPPSHAFTCPNPPSALTRTATSPALICTPLHCAKRPAALWQRKGLMPTCMEHTILAPLVMPRLFGIHNNEPPCICPLPVYGIDTPTPKGWLAA